MAHVASPTLVRQFGSLFEGGCTAGLSDRELIERFTTRGEPADEAAFAAMVGRHGPMVLGVCRQLLGDHHHAEDAFQATFLVLARQARSIRDPELLGAWLYGVALRTARKARVRLARRRQIEQAGAAGRPEALAAVQAEQMIEREQAEALHREIDRLPGSFRLAVVLCYFEGLSPDEAAERLRCPGGTLRSRLVRARDRLRIGLARRGIVLSTTAMAAALAPRSASASVSSLLCDSTTRAAIAFAARHAADGGAPAAAMAQEVLRSMLIHKLKATALSLVLLASLVGGAGYLDAFAQSREGEPDAKTARTEPRPPGVSDDPSRPAPGRMFVTGRVLDPQGKPVPGATTMVYASLKWAGRGDRLEQVWPSVIGRARADDSGRFRLDAPRASSSRYETFGITATAPGYGAGWATLNPDAERPSADVTLRPEQVIQGRLFDVQGRPVQGVTVAVESMRPIGADESEGPYFLAESPTDLPAWSRAPISDADGRFTIRGAGRGLRLGLVVNDPRFARLKVDVETDGPGRTKGLTMAVEPARIIAGRVTYADTGEPAPHARVTLDITTERYSAWAGDLETDAQGHYRANPGAGARYHVTAFAPDRQPYLSMSRQVNWPKGSLEQTVDLELPRGVVVRGKVIEEGSGKPVAGARISYLSKPAKDPASGAANGREATAADGSFQLGVVPGPGYLTVLGPGEDYVYREIGQRMVDTGQPGGRRLYSHAFHKLDLKPGSGTQDVTIALRPSKSVPARVVGPDGRPIHNAVAISRVILQPAWIAWLFWRTYYRTAVRDGHLALHGLADEDEVPVYVLDAQHKLGATVLLSGKSAAGGPVTVRLQPCGAARARLVDPAGKPAARCRDGYQSYMTMMVVTPGRPSYREDGADLEQPRADEELLSSSDSSHYPKGLISDDRGILDLPVLIPGAKYRIYDGTTGGPGAPRLRKEFIVKSGETLDLGDILVERPR